MKYYISFLLLLWICYGASEPSAFEKQSGATKKDLSNLQSITQNLLNLTTQIKEQQEALTQSQEGLMSLYESQHQKFQTTIQQNTTNTQDIENLKTEVATFKTLLQDQGRQIADLDSKMQEIHALTLKTQESILQELEKLNNTQTKGVKKQSEDSQKNPIKFDKNKSAELFAQGKEFITKKQYKSAKDIMLWLKDNKYKTPEVTFYLGEIAYLQKDYHLAIKYYKASVALSDGGTYMPTLLLHTALCFKGIKDMPNYNSFLEVLIATYPQSKEAAQAKELKQ
ncbi:tetratricopeptide repeat protein [Helicobacter equorum]|uniref:tetratricopeptide repeat protein n=1 Tax=Helicobacter equorum TaxID=361872 RepID=UPI000CF19D7C|nr:hypothetical protein [Helicobacter equorum]